MLERGESSLTEEVGFIDSNSKHPLSDALINHIDQAVQFIANNQDMFVFSGLVVGIIGGLMMCISREPVNSFGLDLMLGDITFLGGVSAWGLVRKIKPSNTSQFRA